MLRLAWIGWPRGRTALVGGVLALCASTALSQGALVKRAELIPTESGYALEAHYDLSLSESLLEALVRGLTLNFVTEFELVYPRWWTFNLWNRVISDFRTRHRLAYNPLTRQYRLSFGSLHRSFDTLDEALAALGEVRYAPAVRFQEVDPRAVYLAALRLRLDTSQLPKPLQMNALGSRDWSLNSDWYRWTFKP
jgi:hypothetical protein